MDPLRDLGRRISPEQSRPPVFRCKGVVTATAAGPPATVTVTINGSTTAVPGLRYLASYTPVVSDVVEILNIGGDLLVLGDLAP